MGVYAKRGAQVLAKAGITVNGKAPWDLQTNDPDALFAKVFRGGTLAFCEAYMDGEWRCDDMFELFCRVFTSRIDSEVQGFSDQLLALKTKVLNLQSIRFSRRVARDHYDLGNDFYALWLDPTMTYSSAIWANVDNLADAQLQKIDHIGNKLKLEPGMTVLDIGCGWGALAYHLAKNFGAKKVVGLTLSQQQAIKARERCAGLPVEIALEDYRQHVGRYDRIVSVGMIEHVGVDNYSAYMAKAFAFLNPGGLFLCHGIVGEPRAKSPFMDKYIFPGGELGSVSQITKAAEGTGFRVEDWENFGHGYYHTLMAWRAAFMARREQIMQYIGPDILRIFGTVDRFMRGWADLYLLGDAAAFFVRKLSVGQFMFSKELTGQRYIGVRI